MLETIHTPADLRNLSYAQLDELCAEIRTLLINTVSETGGHLASNLGTVELTIALNRVYNASKDKLIFDVGHQCYTHKILNGRREAFGTLRQFGGISGFPKPNESAADPFIAGHASDSVSVALGMARARTLLKQDYDVCAVIGDGALTGGLAYEGIENVSASLEPVVIILNDNAMSISSNVGGMSRVLHRLRLSEGYYGFKKRYRAIVGINSQLYRTGHRIKEEIKQRLFAGNMFTALGLNYLGPIDGHNIRELEGAIRLAKEIRSPVLLHVITQKGKGYNYAEAHPDLFHGVGSFNPVTGELGAAKPGFCDRMGKMLCTLAEKDERITAITAAMTDGTGLFPFAQQFPKRFFDVGIAEGHAVSMAAGMAKQGLIPVFAVYSSFLQRAYDMILHDVSLQNLHVVFCVDRAGIVGNDGETHNGVFDLAYLSTIPGMTVLAPASFAELETMLKKAIYEIQGPVAIRYPRGAEGEYKEDNPGEEVLLRQGDDVTMVTYGRLTNQCLAAAVLLERKGIQAELIKLGQLHPLQCEEVMKSLKKTGRLLMAEDVCREGCIGEKLLVQAQLRGLALKKAVLLNTENGILPHGSVPELLCSLGLDSESIAGQARKMVQAYE